MRMRLFALTAAALSFTALTGCADDESSKGLGQDPIGSVKSALSSPTGEVDEDSAPEVLSQSTAQDALDHFSSYAFIPGLDAFGNIDGFVSTDLDQVEEVDDLDDLDDLDNLDDLDDADDLGDLGDLSACLNGTELSGTLDVRCASDGAASGSIGYQVQQNGANVSVELTYANVCEDDLCASGTLLVDASVSEASATVTVAADFDVTQSGDSFAAQWGAQISASAAGASVEWVVFDGEGDSYVLSATATDAGGSVSITGENGTFSCDYSDAGSAGSCAGSGEFSW